MKIKILLLTVLLCLPTVNAKPLEQNKLVKTKSSSKSVSKDNSQNLPIRRVILYSNGVAYIERRGVVSGDAEVNLSFKQSQVDDVLKSMTVLDLGQGRIGAVSYNSSAPPSARMAEIPFGVDAKTNENENNGGIAGVLSQLQGAKVLVTSAKGTASGAILTVEKREVKTEKETLVKTFLVIASETGEISSFDLADVRSVKLLDEDTRNDVKEFANASALTRRRDAKTITVTSQGTGQRELLVSYIIAAPIWKTTYRVVLDEAGKPFFQGWAIVDNVSEEDWEGVQLSLVSGSPISFIQNIQKPFYRYRPVVPIPNDLQVTPQIYETGTPIDRQDNTITTKQINELPINGRNPAGFQVDGASGRENTFLIDGKEVSNFRTGDLNSNNSIPAYKETNISDALTNDRSGVQTAATGGEIGDLFEYKIAQPMTVLRNRSALIPIVQTKMEGEKVSVYNEAVQQSRPLSGMRLTNTSGLTLESGSLTVLDQNAYAGEALMERLKPKEQRLISYALDLGTHVRVRLQRDNEPAKLIKVVNGVFQVHYFLAEEKQYEISNQTDRAKVLYIEYPIRQGWQLSDNIAKPDYTTQKYYRFRVELKPLEEKVLVISEKQPLMDGYELTSLSQTTLNLFLTRRYIDDSTRKRLEKLIDIREKIGLIDVKLASFETEKEAISEDQERLRDNIEALAKTGEAKQLIARYVQKADSQETRLEEITKERRNIEAERDRLRNELASEIRVFDYEQKN